MADEPFTSPTFRFPTPQRTPGELVWSLQKEHERLTCELHDRGEALGVEVSTWRNGDFYHSHRFERRALAEHYASALRQRFRARRVASGTMAVTRMKKGNSVRR